MHLTTCVPYAATPLPPLLLLLMTVDFPLVVLHWKRSRYMSRCVFILYQYQPIPLHIIMFIHTYVCAHMYRSSDCYRYVTVSTACGGMPSVMYIAAHSAGANILLLIQCAMSIVLWVVNLGA